jgi:excinuclease ABC subunit C
VLDHTLFLPESSVEAWIEALPARTAVFALFGHNAQDEPYISKTANLRRRIHRLLVPTVATGKRLNLGGKVSRLEYSETGSQFATSLLLIQATRKFCGGRARDRLRLRPPALLCFAAENAYPRVYITNRIAQRALASTYGPFASRTAAERFLDDSLNFFELRRCTEELHPDPAFPGCVYSEMKMCLAPCFRGCTDQRYAEEARRVRDYFSSRGALTIAECERERETASAALDFEAAARLHQRVQKLKAVAHQAAPLVHPLAELDAVIVQPAVASATGPDASSVAVVPEKLSNRPLRTEGDGVAIFLVSAGKILGPRFFSVEGMRHPNERAGSSSLFAHPALLEPTPLEESTSPNPPNAPRGRLEQRLLTAIVELETAANDAKLSADELSEHLSLLTRWYYRPPARRVGEIFFRNEHREFSIAKILRGVSRVFCGQKETPEPPPEDAAATLPNRIPAL